MSKSAQVFAVLNAETDLTDLLPGGLFDAEAATFPLEINTDTMSDTFDDENGLMAAWGAVRGRAVTALNGIRDVGAQVTAAQQVIEVYLFDDSTAGYSTIEAAAELVYASLASQTIAGSYRLRWIDTLQGREEALHNACRIRLTFNVKFRKEPA